jgi:hypothetical protein
MSGFSHLAPLIGAYPFPWTVVGIVLALLVILFRPRRRRRQSDGSLEPVPAETPSDRDALECLREASNTEVMHSVEHYLYFPSEEAARSAAAAIHERGFDASHRLGALGDAWLVLVKSQIIPTESRIAELRAMFEQIAADNGGEYDGWEAETTGPNRV